MTANGQIFVVIPAAGLSRRMGRPKLLLQIGGQTVLSRLVNALEAGMAGRPASQVSWSLTFFCVVRKSDRDLIKEAQRLGAQLVVPESDPPDMRASVELAIAAISASMHPQKNDLWLLIPADHPVLEPDVVPQMLDEWERCPTEIMVPTYRHQRGHPTLLRWELASKVCEIPSNHGLNWLIRSKPERVSEMEFSTDAILLDLDTPEDYENLSRRFAD